jgi:hypothetical protein
MHDTYNGWVDDGKDHTDIYWAIYAAACGLSLGLLIGISLF